MTLLQHIEIRDLVGTDINELEYIDHIFIYGSITFFQIVHINGCTRFINALDYIANL